MKPTEKPDRSVETLRGLWRSPRTTGETKVDPAAREKAWKTAIDAARQSNRLLANAGDYGASVANDPAKLLRAARDEAQAAANPPLVEDEKPAAGYADEAVSAVGKSRAPWDWSAVPRAGWEGLASPVESASPSAPDSPDGLKIVRATVDPAAASREHSRRVKLEQYLDLTDPAVQARLQVSAKTLLADETLVRQIGREAYVAGFHGLIAPSADGKIILAFGSL